MRCAVIFGATGQDGAFLSKLLLEKNYRVVGVSRNVQAASLDNLDRLKVHSHIELVSAAIKDPEQVTRVIRTYQPDEIYNLAGQSSVSRSFNAPVETFESISTGSLNLLEAVRVLNSPARVFTAGSGDCFGDLGGQTATEKTLFSPLSPYGMAKAAAHWQTAVYRQVYGLFACTGILFNHESHLRPDCFVTQKIVRTACEISRGQASELVMGNISIERDWGWAPEYVAAMWMMLQQDKPEDYILATGVTMRLEDFIAAVFQRLGLDWKDHVKTDQRFFRTSDIQTHRASPAKAAEKLDWKARFNGRDVAAMMVDAELETFKDNK